LPVLVNVSANTEAAVPWKVPAGPESCKVFTAFLPADGEASREAEDLISQILQQKQAEGPAAQRLYGRLSEWAGQDRSGSSNAGHQEIELGAALSTGLMSPEAQGQATSSNNNPSSGRLQSNWRVKSRQLTLGTESYPVVICEFASTRR
jgi:hypothetical protein